MPEPPKKPTIPLCTIDYPRNECVCGIARGSDISSIGELRKFASTLNEQSNVVRKPLSECDRYVATSPKGWEKLINAFEESLDYISTYCGKDNRQRQYR